MLTNLYENSRDFGAHITMVGAKVMRTNVHKKKVKVHGTISDRIEKQCALWLFHAYDLVLSALYVGEWSKKKSLVLLCKKEGCNKV